MVNETRCQLEYRIKKTKAHHTGRGETGWLLHQADHRSYGQPNQRCNVAKIDGVAEGKLDQTARGRH
jgi:hypothetical protein